MTQKQQIQLLDSIIPDIISENNPEAVMLKCARKHNLAPAQLEKLAQVFNTHKTIVGLKKQANRGDSFSIVDVPSLVKEYTTYNPEAVISAESKAIHAKVDKLTKSASVNSEPVSERLPNPFSIENEKSDWAAVEGSGDSYDTKLSKQAAGFAEDIQDRRDVHVYRSITGNLNLAIDTASQVAYDSHMDILEKCASIMYRLTPDEGRWAECVRDIVDNMGLDKAASVITAVENYFIEHRHPFTPADLEKDAAADDSVFARDRHGVVGDAEEIYDLQQINKQAHSHLEVFEKAAEPKTKGSEGGGIVDTADALLSGMNNPYYKDPPNSIKGTLGVDLDIPAKGALNMAKATDGFGFGSTAKAEKKIEKAEEQAKMESAIQELMLSDDTIAEADPADVKSLYETIRRLSPTVASDPVVLAPVLKEALQYGSLPIQQVKDLLAAEKDSLGNRMQNLRLDKDILAPQKDQ